MEQESAISNADLKNIIKAIFEARYLKRIERSGTSLLLGAEINETVPEHSFYTALWGIVMHHLNPELDQGKLLTMCLIHDLEEVRIGDLNQINKLYFKEERGYIAFSDMWKGSGDLGLKLTKIHKDRLEAASEEAKAAHDCDTLAELVTEKEYQFKGNKEAEEWMEFTLQRLETETGRRIGRVIMETRITEWWEEIKNSIRKKHGINAIDYNFKYVDKS